MIKASVAKTLGLQIKSTVQSAHQADGSSPLHVIGETNTIFTHENHTLVFEGLVVENLDSDVLAGIPFMERNDISIRPSKQQIIIGEGYTYTYGLNSAASHVTVARRAQVLRASVSETTTIWPGEFLELKVPEDFSVSDDDIISLEQTDSSQNHTWPAPTLLNSIAGRIRIPNFSSEPQTIKRNAHIGTLRATFVPDNVNNTAKVSNPSEKLQNTKFSQNVRVDPDNVLSKDMKSKFHDLLHEHDDKFDEFEAMGVFRKPEDINVNVEYVNPSFLVKKPSGDFRLVTAFADVGRYTKPQPSLMPDVDSTLRKIAQWKYIAISDLTKSFYQIPLSNDSMKYCGVVTPFRGVRVYVRSAMGMPGSEVALEELTCRVLGDLVQEGIVAKVADDLYCGGSTPEELLRNLDRVLKALRRCDLNLSASKTVIAPKEATILGWVWRQGTICASKHRISTLSSCQIPTTVAGLRSFIGAYKVLSRVVPDCSHFLAPLDDMTAGHDSKEKLLWTDEMSASFRQAQLALNSHKAITLPRPDDQLEIVTDGALRRSGIGATLYINRNGTIMLAGFFSAKLRKNQNMWLPCEIEALSIAASIKHFSPYIIQASSNAAVLTDSKPCVQAFEKLCRGEFSASPRVTTFLSTASRYCVSIRHVAGQSILPSDFASRNAPECTHPSCQICTFVSTTENSVVQQISVEDILNESVRLPFTTRSAWNAIQTECSDLRRTAAHLKQGTRPSKKFTDVKDVKRYLQVASIAKDGILIVKRDIPFMPSRELIVVPRNVLEGLLTSTHKAQSSIYSPT
ncbi:hypothetical protein FSP39_018802 [Pinctada imbricata]|uniref:Reverse transcriptase domain-containing protein n=1 Tax=Pinctada imbricata TaxID=66713 RepID=A0AA88YDL5_PINIB|nr:hypothetical protein FSP39_018802 [Pinctada imbricata]